MARRISRKAVFRGTRIAAIIAGVVLTGLGSLHALGSHTAKVSENLTATSAAPTAHGKARFMVRSSKQGTFMIAASRLPGSTKYDVIVGGVKVGVMKTSMGGSGHVLFSTKPGTKHSLLGFDPRGSQVLVRDEDNGEDTLVGGIPPPAANENACCLSNGDGESECEDMTAAECTAAGGTPVGMGTGTASASCLPDPCASTPPGTGIVCCTNSTHDDENEAECEDVTTQADCAAKGGTVVQASSCDANPCQVTPPTNTAACCVADDDGSATECKTLSAQACAGLGGTAPGAATCGANPCPVTPPANTAACCVAEHDGPGTECKTLSAQACAGLGGTAPGAATCDATPCGTGSGQGGGGSGDGGSGDGGQGSGGNHGGGGDN